MGKLYLASLKFQNQDGGIETDVRLVHADIKDHLNDHQKALLLADWVRDWWNFNYPDTTKLTGVSVKNTIDFVAVEREGVGYDPKCKEKQGGQPVGKYQIRTTSNNQVEEDKRFSVYISSNEDPENSILAGYGPNYLEALVDFLDRANQEGRSINDRLLVSSPTKEVIRFKPTILDNFRV